MLLAILAHVCDAQVDSERLPPAARHQVAFAKDVWPILAESCISCHGPDRQKSSFRVDAKAAALAGGDRGPAILAGKSAQSPLIHYVSGLHTDVRMPPKGELLTAGQVGILRAWIDQGAQWPDDFPAAAPANQPLWSLQPLGEASGTIDSFIADALRAKSLSRSTRADRRTLIRRVYFDLIGLPPSPEQVARFVGDSDPLAYEKLVDELLASPHHGERWARHWLDVVRYADSHGFEMNQPRQNAWPYRDYVIRSFNEDKPYDQFILEQLAGDARGVDPATGFLVAGPWDQVKSPDPTLTAQQRSDELHDMVASTAATFLGLTVGCARCHDHKFDPISQLDYYRMQSLFAGVQHGERPWPLPEQELHRPKLARLRGELVEIESQLMALEPIARLDVPSEHPRPSVNARRNIDRFEPIDAKAIRFVIESTTDLEPCLDELEIHTADKPARNIALASTGAVASSSGNFAGSELHKLSHINDGHYGNSKSWISNEHGKGWIAIELPRTTLIDRVIWGRDREGKYADRLALRYRIEVKPANGGWQTVASSESRQPYKRGESTREALLKALPRDQHAKARHLLDRRTELERQIAELTSTRMVYAGTFSKPAPTHRLFRGDPMQPREAVTPGALSCLPIPLDLPLNATEQQRRLALAKWIIHPANPLTPRVIVNRLWHYHFGRGLVATPSDFGHMGAKPTHPALLDYLARELVAGGWRLKRIHRLIVLSETYQQAATDNPSAEAIDADTTLLWRWPRRRLEGEAIRDTILSVSGQLDLRAGGPGFDVFKPNDNYVRVYEPKESLSAAEYRRMIYQLTPRLQRDGVFGAFDCPDGGQAAPRRPVSTTPLQALNLLNSRFMLDQADHFAARLERESGAGPAARIQRAFLLAFGRAPTEGETAAAMELMRKHGLAALCRALFNSNEFIYVF